MTPVIDDDVTELVVLDAQKVSAVGKPANGTSWLVLKAEAEGTECLTCKGKGTIMEGNRKCPVCKGAGTVAKSDSAEADAVEEEVTGSDAEKAEAVDKALSAADRKSMPSSSFAFVDKNGGKHLPIHDEGHVKSALGRFAQQDFSEAKGDAGDAKQKAAAKIKAAAKSHGIDLDPESTVAEAAKKGAVQDALGGTAMPEVASRLDGGRSGLVGSLTPGPKTPKPDASLTLGGESTQEIPIEARVNDHPGNFATTDGAGILQPQSVAKALAVSSLVGALDQIDAQRQAIKDGTFRPPTDEEAETPGSMPWESYDAATLKQVAECLAACCSALDNIADRERAEAQEADPGDIDNAWDLEEAKSALDYALGIAARLSYHEAAEGEATKGTGVAVKVGRTLSGKNMTALEAAHKHLSAVIEGANKSKPDDESEEDKIVTTVTKDELSEMITTASAQSAVAAVKAILDEQKAEKAEQDKLAVEEAEKNANNGGDVSTADIKPTATADADDVKSVGGSVDPQYVNKGADEALNKQVADQLEELTKTMASVQETVAKIAKRPRPGGPSLDGQARGLAPAAEGRLDGGLVKSAEDRASEIGQLQKAVDEAPDGSVEKERLGERLSIEKLSDFYVSRGFGR